MPDPVLSAGYLRSGFDYVALATDIGLLRNGAQAVLKQAAVQN
jgi:4-hydroxy-2-oxoheptanedioate aldolase